MTRDEIVDLRRRLGLTLREIAKRMGIAASTYHRWETGRTHPDPRCRRDLAKLARR